MCNEFPGWEGTGFGLQAGEVTGFLFKCHVHKAVAWVLPCAWLGSGEVPWLDRLIPEGWNQ